MSNRLITFLLAVSPVVWGGWKSEAMTAPQPFAAFGTSEANAGECDSGGLCLVSTVGADLSPGACAATHVLDATVGDKLNFCYTIVNNTGVDLEYQKLQIGGDDPLIGEISVPNGGTFQYNAFRTVVGTGTYDATWKAWNLLGGYSAELDAGCSTSDYLFADGFGDPAGCPVSAFVDITGTGKVLGLADDGSAAVTMPFAFSLYGTASNQLCIDNNGFVLFGTATCPTSGFRTNEDLMSANFPAPAILPLWDDFDVTSGEVYYEARGAAPDREFVIEWFRRARFDGTVNTDGPTFEVIFVEDGTLRFEYDDVSYYTAWNNRTGDSTECWSGACATIGLLDSRLLFDQFSSYVFAVDDGSGIQWTPTDLRVFTATDSVTVNVGAPAIVVNPSPINATVQAGSLGTVSFALENHGNRDLDWILDEAPPENFHFPIGPRYAPLTIAPDETDVAAAMPSREGLRSMHGPEQLSDGSLTAATAVPAFGCVVVSDTSCEYVSLDAKAPGTFDSIAMESELFFGASFVADDFSKEYVIADATGNLKTVDTVTGVITDVGPTGFGSQMRDIAYDATTDSLFGTAIDGHGTDLFTIDRNTGAASAVHPITGLGSPAYVMGIAVDPYMGLMYGIEIATSTLVAIDKTNGAAAVIGPIGYTTRYSQGLDFDAATGVLYLDSIAVDTVNHANRQNLYELNIYTGHASLIGPIGNEVIQLGAFGIAEPAGPCSRPSDQEWLSLNPASGTTIPAGSTPVSATVDATSASAGDVLSGTVCAASTDPVGRMVATPITVTVTP